MSGFKERVHDLKDRLTHPHHSKSDSTSSNAPQYNPAQAEEQQAARDEGLLRHNLNSADQMPGEGHTKSKAKAAPEVQLLANDTRIELPPHLQRRLQEEREHLSST